MRVTLKAVAYLLIAALAFSVAIDLSMEHPEGLVPTGPDEIYFYEGSMTPPDHFTQFRSDPLRAGDGRIHLPFSIRVV